MAGFTPQRLSTGASLAHLLQELASVRVRVTPEARNFGEPVRNRSGRAHSPLGLMAI